MTYYGGISTASNRADWVETVLVSDDDTGDPIDLSDSRITMTLTNRRRNPNAAMGLVGHYGPFYPDMVRLTGSTDTGEITVTGPGTFMWSFPATRMNIFPQGQYALGIRLERDDQTMQLMAGVVTVLEGIDFGIVTSPVIPPVGPSGHIPTFELLGF